MMRVLIVGGVAGGASAAARLRRLDENAEIILIEKGNYVSYANCGLPYYVGDEISDREELVVMDAELLKVRFHIDIRLRQEAIGIQREEKKIQIRNLEDGSCYFEAYDKLILSTGAEPFIPKISGIEQTTVYTMKTVEDALTLKEKTDGEAGKRALVVGGSFIGIEAAENLARAGCRVTIVELQKQLMGNVFDPDMGVMIKKELEAWGVEVKLGRSLTSVMKKASGDVCLLDDGQEVECDIFVLAAGMKPCTELARTAGLRISPGGHITVNDRMETSDKDIYAVGDAAGTFHFMTGKPGALQLAGPANRQGRIAADQICGLDSRYDGFQGSAVIKVFDKTAAATGLNEAALKRAGENDYFKIYLCPPSHAAYYPGASTIFMKMLFDKKDGRVLGAQFFGSEGCDKRCDVAAALIRFRGTIKDLIHLELCYAPPYNSAKDPLNMAGFIAENIFTQKEKFFYCEDLEGLPRDGQVTLLDVRTEEEYAAGHLEGFVNIPLDRLRDNLDRIPQGKKVYLTCQVGLRGHTASRILAQKGYDVYNLSGGYAMFEQIYL